MNTLHEESYWCQGKREIHLMMKEMSSNELLAPVLLDRKNEYWYGQEPNF